MMCYIAMSLLKPILWARYEHINAINAGPAFMHIYEDIYFNLQI